MQAEGPLEASRMGKSPRRRATYDDLCRVPDHLVAEILDGELFASPRPASPHALAASAIGSDLFGAFHRPPGDRGGPGGWWLLFEPELHLGEDVLVPDIAGWRREGMPVLPNVAAPYKIGQYEVTNAQYAELLNSVAATATNALYNTSMSSDAVFGGITRSGSPGSYSYAVKSGFASKPVTYVSFWDAARFSNWLQNGQPTGLQTSLTTEDGAYTLTPAAIAANSVLRNGAASVFVPSESEWYKAAYYDPIAGLYYDYPTGTNAARASSRPATRSSATRGASSAASSTSTFASRVSPSPPRACWFSRASVASRCANVVAGSPWCLDS